MKRPLFPNSKDQNSRGVNIVGRAITWKMIVAISSLVKYVARTINEHCGDIPREGQYS